jgi:hypothetical protein
MVQLKGIVFVMMCAPIATAIILAGLKVTFGSLRATTEDQIEGLDLTSHSESVYGLAGGGVVAPEGTRRSRLHEHGDPARASRLAGRSSDRVSRLLGSPGRLRPPGRGGLHGCRI